MKTDELSLTDRRKLYQVRRVDRPVRSCYDVYITNRGHKFMYVRNNQGYGTLTFAVVSIMALMLVTVFVHANDIPTNDFGRLDAISQSR